MRRDAMYFARQFPTVPIQLSLRPFVMFDVLHEIHSSFKIYQPKNYNCDSISYIHSTPGVIDSKSLFFERRR
jgi:hypothetical protein